MKRLPAVGSLVRVDWLDAHGGAGEWQPAAEVELKLRAVTTVGFLVGSAEDCVAVGLDRDSEGNYNGVGVIPRALIKRVTRLG